MGFRSHLVPPAEPQPEVFGGDGGRVGVAFMGTVTLSLAVGVCRGCGSVSLPPLVRLWDHCLREHLECVNNQ